MKQRWVWRLVAGLLVAGALSQASAFAGIAISDSQALSAGRRLWQNECGGTVDGLTSWNAGEAFASLGIGHYIWYPSGETGPFEESFPELVRFLAAQGAEMPGWVASGGGCPWKTREAFEHDRDSARMRDLRAMLARTVALQARFSADRLQAALPKMVAAASPDEAERIQRQFARVAASPNGVYALLDYVNFKGEGVLATERYQGQGWGLLQVLAGMKTDPGLPPGPEATREFSRSAARVLTNRVTLSPPERHEARWLPGWKSRVATYAPGP